MIFDFQYVVTSFTTAIHYIPATLALSLIPLFLGIIFGTMIAVCRRFRIKFVAPLADIAIPVMKGIPLVLYLFIMNFLIFKPFDMLAQYYAWADIIRYMDKLYIGIIAISIYAIVIISETMRSALMSVGKGQYEACYSVGLTRWQALWRVILPQSLPVAIPVLGNNLIGLIKGSSVVYLITVLDVMNGALTTAQINYRFLEAYIAAAFIYWGICLLTEWLFTVWENHTKKYQMRIDKHNLRKEVL
ncbi:amino acid ABC transporter permease [Pectinatus haikarae]|uniref:L-cystine transport system permease protein n=1 Tax=Pectinatus haikarae TaxID=349096 RepID=A0ABT9Y9G5_9FIRM|nr:amino acid ABC transporter permease [Pectinatus haikarae]MDQ0204502.1 L-cystine transport system permease protein [Pectinatus haikarae]